MKKITVAGYYGFGNAGDEAILAGMLHRFHEQIPDARVCVLTANVERTKSLHNVEAVDTEDIPALIDSIRRSDVLILGGGGLLHDYWALKEQDILTPRHVGLAYYLGILLVAYLLEKPAMLYAAGVGPLQDAETKEVIRWMLSLVQTISVRDPKSADLLRTIDFDNRDLRDSIHITADPAFSMPLSDPGQATKFLRNAGVKDGPLIGVILRYWEYGIVPGDWQREVARALDSWVERTGGQVVFLPFQRLPGTLYEDDARVSRQVIAEMVNPSRAVLLDYSDSFTLLPGIISECDVTLCMRMHGIIFSLMAGTPVVSMAYDPKISALMAMADLSQFSLPIARWEGSCLFEAVKAAGISDLTTKMEAFVEEMQLREVENLNLLVELLEQDATPISYADHRLRKLVLKKTREAITSQETQHRLEYGTYRLEDLFLRAQDFVLELAESKKNLQDQAHEYLGELERKRESESRLNLQIASAAEEIRLKDEHITNLENQAEDNKSRLARLEAVRDQLIIERDDSNQQLAALRDTIAVRISARYWSWAKRLIPIGSRRRRTYQSLRAWIRRRIRFPEELIWVRENDADQNTLTRGQPIEEGVAYLLQNEERLKNSIRYFAEDQYRSGRRKVVTIFTSTPFVESEGQRSIHLAREFSKRGYAIVFAYWRWDRSVRQSQDRLDDGIFQVPIDEIIASRDMLTRTFEDFDEKLAIIEFPYQGLFENLAIAHGAGWIVIYDVIDDWEAFNKVGQAHWYDELFEHHLVSTADVVLTINAHLAMKVVTMGRDAYTIVPNGVSELFTEVHETESLELGEITLGYFGYLSPAWFDWELVRATAIRHPRWKIYLIGYGDAGEAASLPANVAFLGKQPWRKLAAYAANWDVAIIPFRPGAVSKAADPIKTYEYLSLGLPVVSMGVDPPAGGEQYVYQAGSQDEFIEQISQANQDKDILRMEREAFASRCTWSHRVQRVEDLLEQDEQRVGEKRRLFYLRS